MRAFLSVPGTGDALGQRDEREQRDRHQRQQHDPGVDARGLELVVARAARAGRGPRRRPAHSPNTAPITDTVAATFRPLNRNGSAAGSSTERSVAQPRGAEAAHQLEQLGLDRAQPVEQVHGDREEADQRDDRELRADAVVEGEHEERREHHDRDRLRGHEQRVGGVAQRPEEVHRDGERRRPRRPRSPARAAPRTSVTPGVVAAAATSRRAARRKVSTGEASVRSSTESSEATPCQASTNSASSRRGEQRTSQRRAPPARAAAARRTRGSVDVARGRGRSTSISATTRPGRGESTATRSARKSASSTSWVTSSTVRGSSRERAGEPVLHRGAGDRVERAEGLVEQQHRPAGQQRAQEGHALAHAAGQLGRARALELGQPEALEQRLGAPARLARAARPGTRAPARRCRARRARAAAGRAGACRRRPRGARGAVRAAHVDAARVGLLEARPPARAASTCRSPTARPRPATSPGAPSGRALERGDRCGTAASTPEAKRLRRGSLGLGLHRSLRGHYPTGSKGQRRHPGRPLSPHPRAPLLSRSY